MKITAAFQEDGQIIGAIIHQDTKDAARRARSALKRETAPRHEVKVHEYVTVNLARWLEPDQLLEVDVGLDIVKS